MKKLIILCCVLIAAGSIMQTVSAAEKPTYTAHRTTGTIYVDGNMTEEDWLAAEPVGDFVFPWYEKGKKEQTDARMLWDDEYLYVFFTCEDEHISAHFYQRNSAPYKDDCVEVFIAPNPDHPLWYANNEINCLGTWLIGVHTGDRNEYVLRDKILVGRSHKGTINNEDDIDDSWTIELGIPFESLKDYKGQLPPRPGDRWGINLNRCGGDVNEQYSQWTASQTDQPSYHQPQDFGFIVFDSTPVR